ncbi:sugar ABC transporter permease [Bifidobacterium amazonense]|uniref:Sugar ABC transporter permease n=1 Tax=Bifidobacterium amazonense TaxID=2809027 RepID=A0ABS9VWP3_9BIFI|nr:sugar ABC transporter permease [Bifidobacterium amazonense]MCH9276537.1 sugar ABC transporter permease [Bifidobacterium amazonense]
MSDSSASIQGPRRGKRRGPGLAPYFFVGPFAVAFTVFLLSPLLVAVWSSLFTVKRSGLGFGGTKTSVFIGMGNYQAALQNKQFMSGFGRVLLFGVVQVPLMLGLALLFALLIDSTLVRFKRVAQIVLFIPYAVPAVIAALLWGFLYQPGVSPIVKGLRTIGLDVNFLAPDSVLWSTANITTWCYVGVNMVMIYSALQAIPQDIYEAARIDGASEARIAWSIKIPMIMPTLIVTLFLSIIGTIQLFNEPTVLRTVTSNVSSEFTPLMSIVNTAFAQKNQNLGSAMSVIVALVAFILSAVINLAQRKWEEKS